MIPIQRLGVVAQLLPLPLAVQLLFEEVGDLEVRSVRRDGHSNDVHGRRQQIKTRKDVGQPATVMKISDFRRIQKSLTPADVPCQKHSQLLELPSHLTVGSATVERPGRKREAATPGAIESGFTPEIDDRSCFVPELCGNVAGDDLGGAQVFSVQRSSKSAAEVVGKRSAIENVERLSFGAARVYSAVLLRYGPGYGFNNRRKGAIRWQNRHFLNLVRFQVVTSHGRTVPGAVWLSCDFHMLYTGDRFEVHIMNQKRSM